MLGYVTKNQKRLQCGITTGTCAAAAAKAAATRLLLGIHEKRISIRTPKGIAVEVEVSCESASGQRCTYLVIKESGDDPDVTNHAKILVTVERMNTGIGDLGSEDSGWIQDRYFTDEQYPNLYLDGGEGVGRITREGLEQRIGQAAINVVPRQMIFQAVGEVCELADDKNCLLIHVTVPKGRELAERTFNGRLGIEGGISILGTSGILEPMSERAIVDTIETQIRQMQIQGKRNLLITPGNYGQGYAAEYLGLDLEDSVKCSNYIGETLDIAVCYEMKNILLVGNIGKLVKLAAGIMNTHSKTADARGEIMALHTVLCGGTREMAEEVLQCINTEQMLEYLDKWELLMPVLESICKKIQEHVSRRVGASLRCGVILFSEKFGYLGQTEEAEAILKEFQGKGE